MSTLAGSGFVIGNASERPAAGSQNQGLIFVAKDTSQISYSDGSTWQQMTPGGFRGGRVTKSVSQNFTDGAVTAITWDSEDYDTDAGFNLAGSTTNFVVPYTGYWSAGAFVGWDNNSTGARLLRIVKGGNVMAESKHACGATFPSTSVHTMFIATANDVIDVRAYQNSGGTRTITSANFWLQYMGP